MARILSCSIEALPLDLLQSFIIPRFLLDPIFSEEDLDLPSFPSAMVVLPLVNKWFSRVLKSCPLVQKINSNFRNLPFKGRKKRIVSLLRHACRHSRSIPFLEFLTIRLKFPLDSDCVSEAVLGGDIRVVRWITARSKLPFRGWTTSDQRLVGSSIEVFEWAISNVKLTDHGIFALRGAVRRGDLQMTKYLWNVPSMPREELELDSRTLARENTLEVLRWVSDQGAKFDRATQEIEYLGACSLDIVRWACEEMGVLIPGSIVSRVPSGVGDVSVLRYCLETLKSSLTDDSYKMLFSSMLFHNRVDLLRYCVSIGIKFKTDYISADCSNTSLETWKYLSTLFDKEDLSKRLAYLTLFKRPPESFIPVDLWRFFLSFGISPNKSDEVHILATCQSPSHKALETLRFLIEEMGCQWPTVKPSMELMREDVRMYYMANRHHSVIK